MADFTYEVGGVGLRIRFGSYAEMILNIYSPHTLYYSAHTLYDSAKYRLRSRVIAVVKLRSEPQLTE